MADTMNPLKVGITVGLPFCGRPIAPEWALALRLQDFPLNLIVQYVPIKGQEVGAARERMAELALDNGSQWLWFIDDDTIPPFWAIRYLWGELAQRVPPLGNAAVMGGIYCSKTDPAEPLVYMEEGQGAHWAWKRDDVFQCGQIGTGCMLIHVPSLRRIPRPWFRTVDSDTRGLAMSGVPVHKNLVSDDIWFCRQVKAAGLEIWAHGGVLPMHVDVATGRYYSLPEGCYPLTDKPLNGRPYVPERPAPPMEAVTAPMPTPVETPEEVVQ